MAYNERGQLTRFKYGNGVETTTTYAADTGKIQAIQAGTGNAVQNQQYQFDEVGNLTQRIDSNTGVTETYSYDSLNRLQTQSLIAGTVTRINTWQYNALGNILTQTEVGAYQYNASGQNSTRPHATTQVLGTVGQYIDPKYSYDAAGNLQTVSSRNGNGRSHYFTSFNMPESLASTGSNPASAAFIYGTDNQRVKEILARTQNGSVKTRTVYQIHPDNAGGLYYEKEQKEDGSILITSVGSAPSTITATKYWHKDHLGSNVAITDAAGVVIERMAYDPFGKRRTTGGAYDQNGTLRGANTDRGFTGHEHLDDLGFIHMNGRIFDPTLGRFLSADPYIQYADNLQSYNRYSYLMNNPLNATDPTGYFKLKKALRMVVAIVVAYYTGYYQFSGGFGVFGATSTGLAGGLAAFGNAVISGAALSGISAGSWKAAGQGALSGALFWGAGSIGEAKSFAEGGWQMTALHAAAGCVSAEASGGDCGRAALSAGFAQFAGGNMPSWGSDAANLFRQAILGGTASYLAGGNFANGAATAAFAYLYNAKMHKGSDMQSRLDAGQKFDVLDDRHIAFMDKNFDGPDGQALHEIHVYDRVTADEVGVYKEGRFIKKHGKSPDDIRLSQGAMERLNGVDLAKLDAQGRTALAASIRSAKPWRSFVRAVPVVGAAVGLWPLATNPDYTWRQYGEDTVCGTLRGCGDVQ